MAARNRLARLRAAQEISRSELAELFGVHERTVYRWETGETPIPEKHWERLSELFGVSVAYLLGLNGDDQTERGREVA